MAVIQVINKARGVSPAMLEYVVFAALYIQPEVFQEETIALTKIGALHIVATVYHDPTIGMDLIARGMGKIGALIARQVDQGAIVVLGYQGAVFLCQQILNEVVILGAHALSKWPACEEAGHAVVCVYMMLLSKIAQLSTCSLRLLRES